MSRSPLDEIWRFWIDVGGTFTDCLARSPTGELSWTKVLSSGRVQAVVESAEADRATVSGLEGCSGNVNATPWQMRFTTGP